MKMGIVRLTRVAAAFVIVLSPLSILAQEARSSAGGPPPYLLANEVTTKAIVVGTHTLDGPNVTLEILDVTIDGRTMHVILGPNTFVKALNVTFAAGAPIEVTGVPGAQINGEPAMNVRLIKVATRTLTFRDAAGKPAWVK